MPDTYTSHLGELPTPTMQTLATLSSASVLFSIHLANDTAGGVVVTLSVRRSGQTTNLLAAETIAANSHLSLPLRLPLQDGDELRGLSNSTGVSYALSVLELGE